MFIERAKSIMVILALAAAIVIAATLTSASQSGNESAVVVAADPEQSYVATQPGISTGPATTTQPGISTGPATTAQPIDQTVPAKPALKNFKLDADKLLFGKIGARLRIISTPVPAGADTSKLKYKSSDPKIATVSKKGLVTARAYGKCVITISSGTKKKTVPVQVADKWVAVTWDDGPGPYTADLLSALNQRQVDCTFFIMGWKVDSPARVKLLNRILASGCEIGNHTWKHDGGVNDIVGSVRRTDHLLRAATGQKAALLRPPGGVLNHNTARCGKPVILWSVDPRDWENMNAEYVKNYIIGHAWSGSIILIHDVHPTSVEGGLKAIDYLAKQGYAFVTVSELLGDTKAGVIYRQGPVKVRTQKILRDQPRQITESVNSN